MFLKEITGTIGKELSKKKIALCVTASVSITEAPRIARLLMRHGAEVIPVLTPKAGEFVSPMIFEWSTGNPPITRLTGKVEHVELVTSSTRVNLVLIAPCTANTLSKIANGIADEPVSALACTALGSGVPILIAPAMHEPMLKNQIIQRAKDKLISAGVKFVEGKLLESKSKLAEPEEILRAVLSLIGNTSREARDEKKLGELKNISFVITAGATREPIDSVRYITNSSSGKMGVALAEEALQRGAKRVCLIHGPGVLVPESLGADRRLLLSPVVTSQEMLQSVLSTLSKGRYDVLISAAAPADYAPDSSISGKVSTARRQTLNLRLVASKKIISVAKEKFPRTFVAAFKAEPGLDNKTLLLRASETLKSSGADLIVANDIGRADIGFGSDFDEAFIMNKRKEVKHLPKARKNEIAGGILDAVLEEISDSAQPKKKIEGRSPSLE